MTTKTASAGNPAPRNTFTVVINRRIKVGRESDYKAALIEFIDYALHCPGYLSITVESPSPPKRDIVLMAVTTSWSELGMLAAVVALRMALNFSLERELAELPPPAQSQR